MNSPEIMHDIETLDTKETAVVLSIGAVKFTDDGLGVAFYRRLAVDDQIERGRTISGSTVSWWMKQSDEARKVFAEPTVSVETALRDYAEFMQGEEFSVWGNGAMFDNSTLLNLYAQYGIPRPWSYRGDRCYRTVIAEAYNADPRLKDLYVKPTVAHNALADAMCQANHLIAVRAALRGPAL